MLQLVTDEFPLVSRGYFDTLCEVERSPLKYTYVYFNGVKKSLAPPPKFIGCSRKWANFARKRLGIPGFGPVLRDMN